MKKLILLLPLLAGSWAYAVEPQATPAQCKKANLDSMEKCLINAGNKNFRRDGATLTVFLANSKEVQFKNRRLEEINDVEHFTYLGYDPKTGVHNIHRGTFNSNTVSLVDHVTGMDYSKFGNLSPNRQWALASTTHDEYCQNLGLAMYKIPPIGQAGDPVRMPMASDSSAECRKFIAKKNGYREELGIKWLSDTSVKVTWFECIEPGEDCGKERQDSTVLRLKDGQWIPDRIPFSKKKGSASDLVQPTSSAALPSSDEYEKSSLSNQSAQPSSLRTGMSLEEVEKLLGRSADRFKIDPLALLGKQEITRVWTANGRQLEVTFVGGVVSSWR